MFHLNYLIEGIGALVSKKGDSWGDAGPDCHSFLYHPGGRFWYWPESGPPGDADAPWLHFRELRRRQANHLLTFLLIQDDLRGTDGV